MEVKQQTLFDLDAPEGSPEASPDKDQQAPGAASPGSPQAGAGQTGIEQARTGQEEIKMEGVEPVEVRTEETGQDEVGAGKKPPETDRPLPTVLPKKRGRKPRDPSLIIKKEPARRGRKSLKEAAAEADLIEIPNDDILFRKQYYTMGEVAAMFRVNHSQIRLWESEFAVLQPKKNKKGDRYFRPADIKNLHLIYYLLRQRKFTIEGAKEYLKRTKHPEARFEIIRSLEKIREFLLEIKAHL